MRCLPVVVVVVDCAGHMGVRGRGRTCWPWCGSPQWSFLVSMACTTRVFEGVVVAAGRYLGRPDGRPWCRWSRSSACSRVWTYSVAEVWSVSSPTRGRVRCRWCGTWWCSRVWVCLVVTGRDVSLSARGVDGSSLPGVHWCGRAWWLLPGPWCGPRVWSPRWASTVFVVVGVFGGRGAGRRRCRWGGIRWCSGVWTHSVAVIRAAALSWLWPLPMSMVWDICVFVNVRGCGRGCWSLDGSFYWSDCGCSFVSMVRDVSVVVGVGTFGGR